MTDAPDPLAAIGRAKLLLLSAPWLGAGHSACAVPVGSLGPFQCLLGTEAQLAAFVAALGNRAAPILVLPAPELFQAPESFAALRRLAGAMAGGNGAGSNGAGKNEAGTSEAGTMALPGGALHLRFGPARTVRLLKGARTVAVLAEQPAVPPVALGEHPFGGGLLPAGTAAALLYAAPAAVHAVAPRRFDRRTADGAALPWSVLPDRFVTADLPDPQASAPDEALPPGLQLQSLAAFDPNWPDPDPDTDPAGGSCPDFAAATTASGPAGASGPAAVLLPWNLDHPGSIVPDLLRKLVRLGSGQPGGCIPVLLPFNGGSAGLEAVATAARAWRAGSSVPGPTGHPASLRPGPMPPPLVAPPLAAPAFVIRVTAIEAAAGLRHRIPFAWLDGGDPEHGWTLRRLAALGLRTVTLRPPGLPPAGLDVTADERLPLTVRDAAGPRLYRSAAVTARRLPALMAITRGQALPPVVPSLAPSLAPGPVPVPAPEPAPAPTEPDPAPAPAEPATIAAEHP